jgi:PAS domain-containing protein
MSASDNLIESQRDKAAFRESEEHYRAVAEAATDAIITIDSDSTILIVNPAAERIFGYSTAEMIGQPLTMLMPEYLRHLHKAGITRYVETGQKHIGWAAVQLPGCIRATLRFHWKSHLQNSPMTGSASSPE